MSQFTFWGRKAPDTAQEMQKPNPPPPPPPPVLMPPPAGEAEGASPVTDHAGAQDPQPEESTVAVTATLLREVVSDSERVLTAFREPLGQVPPFWAST